MFKSVQLWKNITFKSNASFCVNINQLKREKESKLAELIQKELSASYISVKDTSVGGSACGQMYKIVVESPIFQGKSLVQQHKLVTNAIGNQLKNIHGFNLKTKISPTEQTHQPDTVSQQTNAQSIKKD